MTKMRPMYLSIIKSNLSRAVSIIGDFKLKRFPRIRKFLIVIIVTLFPLLVVLVIYIFIAGPKLPSETDAIIDEVLNRALPEQIVGETGFASSAGLKIWYEGIPPKGTPKGTVLLIMSNGGDGFFWSPSFMQAFVAAGYQLIRYDHRGTGMSDWVEEWDRQNPYSLVDMAGDAVTVLDALEVQEAHLVGVSLGGMVAQEVAINHPDRVASLTLIMASGDVGDPDLPSLSIRYLLESTLKKLPLLKYRIMGGEKNLIKERVAGYISLLGDEELDIQEIAEVILYDRRNRRGMNARAVFQHIMAVTGSGSRYEKLRALDMPTLVIHGKDDQLLPIEHGEKLVDIIPNAKGLWVDDMGHVFPLPKALTKDILSHIGEIDS
jgi:pimeloyl-ACP methyl ester carboxylesterase